MIRRTMDATFLNEVANDPGVRPYVGGVGVLDLSPILANPANYALVAEHGGWILEALGSGTYELHTLFREQGRGKAYYIAAREALRWMFTRTDCVEILTKCPDDNPGARMAAVQFGFRERFHRDNAWSPGVGISYQAFTVDDWSMRDIAALKGGKAFHEILEAAKPASGSELPDHPEDEAHDRAAGAAYLMIKAGSVGKGVAWYNRWAAFAGYPPVVCVGANVFDLGEGVIVQLLDGEMDVLLTR